MKYISSEFKSGFLKSACDSIAKTLIYETDALLHAETYNQRQNTEMYAEPEFSGKYIDLCVRLYNRYGDKKALENAEIVIESILKNQRSDGYLGTLAEGIEMAGFGVWNQTFTLIGMLSYYKQTGDKRVLDSMLKAVSFTMEYFVGGQDDILNCINNGTQHISVLLPLCCLYIETGDSGIKKYIDYIVDRMKNSDLNYFSFDSILSLRSRKGIESFVILLGMLKYAEIYNDESAVNAVCKYWQEVNDTQIRNTGNGTVSEVWWEDGNACRLFGVDEKPNETCVAVGWCELSMALFFLRHDTKYLDAVDKTLYNHILASLNDDGSDFAYYQPNFGRRVRTTEENMYKCCRYRGFTLFSYLNGMLVYEDADTIIPMLYASYDYKSADSNVSMTTDYPYNPAINLSVSVNRDKQLKIRVPAKCKFDYIKINDDTVDCTPNNGYIILSLTSGTDYQLEIALTNQLLCETGIYNEKRFAAFNYGCILLAAHDICLDTDMLDGKLQLNSINETNKYKMEFVLKGKRNNSDIDIGFCEYSSADNFSVWMPY